MNEKNGKKTTDYKVRAFMALARSVRPGIRAEILARPLIWILKALGVRKSVALRNAALCFTQKSEEEREKIIADSYENMIRTGVEMLAWQSDPSLIDKMVTESEGLDVVQRALRAGRGAVVFSPHLGNWELGAAWCARHFPFYGLVRHSDSPFQRELIETLRETSGLRTISNDSSMKRIITLLKKNQIVGFLADQHWSNEGITAPLFGLETPTAPGPAAFSVLAGAPMIPMCFTRTEPFKFRLKVYEPLECPPGMERDAAILYLVKEMNKTYEKMITACPGQWLWQHRRFREIIS